jgi:diguanylate cyclase (GGDEF)-like protein/putative nucleotidyltransferase with HDIG domain
VNLSDKYLMAPVPARLEAARTAALRFFAEEGGHARDRIMMARALGALFMAGGLIGFVSLALPHEGGTDLVALGALCGVAVLVGIALTLEDGRLPGWIFAAASYGAIVLIASAVYVSDDSDSAYAFYFVLVAMFAAYFLSLKHLVLLIACAAVLYPIVVGSLGGGDESAQRWLLTIWTMIVVGAFIAILRQRMRGLIARLSDAARTDPLTELLNRRGFGDVFDLELERSRRSGRPCALVMADLDHFKRVNDMLGHPAGDERLRKFATLLEAGKRRIDAAARMGGEEFALLLPETDEHGAYVIAERLRHSVRDAFAPDQLALTVSFGVAAYPNHGASGDQLLQAADQALYVAKELGRDRTAIYRAEVSAHMLSVKDRAAMRSEGYLSAMLVLAEAVDLRDAGSAAHSETVGRYAEMIAAELGLEEERIERVKLAGVLHDIGKVGTPDVLLQKAGPLDEDEWEEIRGHCELGSRLLSGAGLEDIAGWVIAHHERPDGQGYPGGLAGSEIPPEARILAVADAYEAMVVDRTYRMGIGAERAREELENGAGTQFDPLVVEAFLRFLERSDRALGLTPGQRSDP